LCLIRGSLRVTALGSFHSELLCSFRRGHDCLDRVVELGAQRGLERR
jgi:hypothetical protein